MDKRVSDIILSVNLIELACNNLNFQRRSHVCYGDIIKKLHIFFFRDIDIQVINAEYAIL